MSNLINPSVRDSGLIETLIGPNYRAVIDTEKCTVSGECIKVCEVNAIYEGPKRFPRVIPMVCNALPEMLPGKSTVDQDICTGCGDCITVCLSHAVKMVPVSHE
jgi:NAD-dependent dihydropyrimidine dehydrogenase PreA subunit